MPMRDVFYYGTKPNVHPREKFAENLADARNQCTTEHFWIINEFCDYRSFDWDFDFYSLPDEDVWAEDHNNVWPSQHQKDSGTWLCSEKYSDIIVYRTDVDPIQRKNNKNDLWVELDLIDHNKFDFSWHHDPTEPPYIYRWGSKHYPVELRPVLEYRVPGATEIKYVGVVIELTSLNGGEVTQKTIGTVELLPEWDKWKIIVPVDESSFDFTWRPDPNSPPYIYVFGNQWNDATTEPTLEYHMPDAVDRKYMNYPVALPKSDLRDWSWSNNDDLETFDFSWRPNPHSPPQIYQWADNGPRYTMPDATEVVLMEHTGLTKKAIVNRYQIRTTLDDLVNEHPDEVFWAINPDLT